MIISGFAMGFVFVPLTTMAMGTLSNEQISNASGIYNLMRNTGGSIGIAAMTTFLARGAQTHQAALAPNLSPYNPAFQDMVQRVQESLGGASVEQAYGVIYGMLVKQAAVLSYIDNFRLLAFLCLICAPAAFLFKRVRSGKPPVDIH
jgi:DHA2 family multidrug resistance protein